MVSALDSGASVPVRALAGDIVLSSWARHFTITVPLSTQVYKWVPANLMLGGSPALDQHPIQGGVEILLVASCYRNRDKLRPGGPQTLPYLYSYFWFIYRARIHFFALNLLSVKISHHIQCCQLLFQLPFANISVLNSRKDQGLIPQDRFIAAIIGIYQNVQIELIFIRLRDRRRQHLNNDLLTVTVSETSHYRPILCPSIYGPTKDS